MEIFFSSDFLINLFSAGVRLAAPLLMAALGEIIAERSGLRICIEALSLERSCGIRLRFSKRLVGCSFSLLPAQFWDWSLHFYVTLAVTRWNRNGF